MFAKNTLASAVAAAIGVSAVGVAQADTVFFPYTAISPTVTTVVSVINTSDELWNNDTLHYRYYHKNAANNADPCGEVNVYLPSSVNDIQTIDLGGTFGGDTLGVLFNDPSNKNNWQDSPYAYSLGGYGPTPARGYLTIDNADGNDGETSLAGEAFVFEFGSGAVWGYQAYESDAFPGADGVNADFRHVASKSPSNMAIMPFDEVTTALFVTPVDFNQHPNSGNSYRAIVGFQNQVFDRDENPISGPGTAEVVCVGRVDVADLVTLTVRNMIASTGGWGRIYNSRLVETTTGTWKPAQFADNYYDPNATAGLKAVSSLFTPAGAIDAPSDGAVVIKLEYNVGGTFNGEPVGGVYNNAIMFQPDPNNPFRP